MLSSANRNATPARLAMWVVVCAAAELAGIALATLWWLAADRIEPEPATIAAKLAMLALKGAAGVVEGVLLGFAQGVALKPVYPRLAVRGWVLATVALAVAGWTIGSSFAIFAGPPQGAGQQMFDPGPGLTTVMAAAFGLLMGGLFGAVQALVLRRAAQQAGLWIPGNMAGWALALPIIYLAASSGSADMASAAGRSLLAGAGAGLALGVVTALAIRAMPPRR